MTARYFSHSPRGFANEITIFAVDADQADEWASWFNEYHQGYAPDGHPLVRITRHYATLLLRRDGVLLQTHGDDATYLHGEGLMNHLNHESVKSACRAAIDYRKSCEREDEFQRQMYEAYPEFQEAAR